MMYNINDEIVFVKQWTFTWRNAKIHVPIGTAGRVENITQDKAALYEISCLPATVAEMCQRLSFVAQASDIEEFIAPISTPVASQEPTECYDDQMPGRLRIDGGYDIFDDQNDYILYRRTQWQIELRSAGVQLENIFGLFRPAFWRGRLSQRLTVTRKIKDASEFVLIQVNILAETNVIVDTYAPLRCQVNTRSKRIVIWLWCDVETDGEAVHVIPCIPG